MINASIDATFDDISTNVSSTLDNIILSIRVEEDDNESLVVPFRNLLTLMVKLLLFSLASTYFFAPLLLQAHIVAIYLI